MSAAVRPIYLPGTAALEGVRQRAHTALVAWAREWVCGWSESASLFTTLQVRAVDDAVKARQYDATAAVSNKYEYEEMHAASGCAWFRRQEANRVSFARAVVGADAMRGELFPDDWIAEVIERAWTECARAICTGLLGGSWKASTSSAPNVPSMSSRDRIGGVTDTIGGACAGVSAVHTHPPTSVFALGSGAVEVSCEAIGLYAIVDSGVWRDVSPRERGASAHRSKLTPLDQAAQRSRLRLDVHLGTADVEVLQLLDMRPGDVLRLSQRLTDGISLLCAGQTIARGALGERHGRKALQLLTTNGSTGA